MNIEQPEGSQTFIVDFDTQEDVDSVGVGIHI